jgi:hypothetical protein
MEYWSTVLRSLIVVLQRRRAGVLQYCTTRVLVYWSTVLRSHILVLQRRRAGVLEYCTTPVLDYWSTALFEHNFCISLSSHSYFFISLFPIYSAFHFIIYLMTKKIITGNTVLVTGGRHNGKRAIVMDETEKMFYIKLLHNNQVTRVMKYNVTAIDTELHVVTQQHTEEELRHLRLSIDQLTTLLLKLRCK